MKWSTTRFKTCPRFSSTVLTVMGHRTVRKKHAEINKWEAVCPKVRYVVTGIKTFTNLSAGFNCINLTNGVDKVIILYCTRFFILEAPF